MTVESGVGAARASRPPGAWTCDACGYANTGAPLCERCGVSRAWLEDPPLDLPPAPGPFERPAAWMALLHGALAGFGVLLLVRPEVAPFLALTAPVQAGQVLVSLAAAWTSLNQAALDRLFWRVELETPERCPVNAPLWAHVRLVPYGRIARAHVDVALVSNTYARTVHRGRTRVTTRTRVLARHRVLSGEALRSRRATEMDVGFDAPWPSEGHRDVGAELQASLLSALGWLVPGLAQHARNLREHGGIRIRLTVRVGPWRRRIERRVVVYHLSGDAFAIA